MLTLKIGGSIGLSNPDLRKRKRLPLEEAPLSHTANQLLDDIGKGSSTVTAAARLARQMGKDNMHCPAVATLGTLGASGKYEQNLERDLHRWTRGVHGVHLEPYKIKLPLEVICLKRFVWGIGFIKIS